MEKDAWRYGLLKDIGDPSNHIITSNSCIVICDKYPKAKHHYLVLPREDISSVLDLKKSHIPLLDDLYLTALNIIKMKRLQLSDFKIGFHNPQSLYHLHLHVISNDFVSRTLRTPKHWNSFNTAIFLPIEDARKQLEKFGKIKRLSDETANSLYSTKLKCNQCDLLAQDINILKQHLYKHFKKKSLKYLKRSYY